MKYLFPTIIILALVHLCEGQVYNYQLMNYRDAETNPAALAAPAFKAGISATHQGKSPSSNKFSYQSMSAQLYFPKYYTGIGLSATNTQIDKQHYCQTINAGSAYSVRLFNLINTQIGVSYKWNKIRSYDAQFKEYNYSVAEQALIGKCVTQTINTSIQFISWDQNEYFSFAVLNIVPSGNTSTTRLVAPLYYVFYAGDLGKQLFYRGGTNISFSTVLKKDATSRGFSQSVNVRQLFHITRTNFLFYGMNAGYYNYDSRYFLFRPFISVCRGVMGRHHHSYTQARIEDAVDLMYTFAIPAKSNARPFEPSIQLKYTHNFRFRGKPHRPIKVPTF